MHKISTMIILPLGFSLLICCSSENEREGKFEAYLHSIPELVSPFSSRCDGEFPSVDSLIPAGLWEKFRPGGAPNVMAKINYNDSVVGVIYLYPADSYLPVLKIYDYRGVPIDSLQMIDRYCGLEYESEGYSWIKINGNHIELTDTTKYWERDQEHEIIPNTDRTEMRKAKFEVVANGEIIKLE